MIEHSIEDCHKGLHIKSWHDRNARSFSCVCCGYTFDSTKCPMCNGDHNTLQSIGEGVIKCTKIIDKVLNETCNYIFAGYVDKINDDIPENVLAQEKLLKELEEHKDDPHPHEKGFCRGVVNRDYQ